jgi:hypothetical protein
VPPAPSKTKLQGATVSLPLYRFITYSSSPSLFPTRAALELFLSNNGPIFCDFRNTDPQITQGVDVFGRAVPIDCAWYARTCCQLSKQMKPSTFFTPVPLPTDSLDSRNPRILNPVPRQTIPAPQPVKVYVTVRQSPTLAYKGFTDITWHLFYVPRLVKLDRQEGGPQIAGGWTSLTCRYCNDSLHLEAVWLGGPGRPFIPNIDATISCLPDVHNPLNIICRPRDKKIRLHIFVNKALRLNVTFPEPPQIKDVKAGNMRARTASEADAFIADDTNWNFVLDVGGKWTRKVVEAGMLADDGHGGKPMSEKNEWRQYQGHWDTLGKMKNDTWRSRWQESWDFAGIERD